ncbi:MAG: winged helix-turn-helix domain-containing protein, partial [Alphaproteobacteria bacterium]|nr:winged helix-turn-helix domain-containing protein [Alphaproteobacteria bacterium]
MALSKLDLRLFGGFEARTADGAALSFPTKKAKALLAYLAVHPGKGHSRSSLAGLLWGVSGEEQARASLRQTLSYIRKSLAPTGEEHLVIDG